jgi:hypothetical protein
MKPDAEGYWSVEMGAFRGAVLGPFRTRSEKFEAERVELRLFSITGWPLPNDKCSLACRANNPCVNVIPRS